MTKFELSPKREELFDIVESELVSTPHIYPLNKLELPRNNKIIAIDFSDLPGSHYRGVFAKLIRNLEQEGIRIKGNTHEVTRNSAILVEPSTGNACEDLAIAGTLLGYKVKIVMPKGMPEARYLYTEKAGAEVIRTPADRYTEGMRTTFVDLLRENLDRVLEGKTLHASPNHSGKGKSDITSEHMSKMIDQLKRFYPDINIDFGVFGMGNGSSLYHPGKRLKELFSDAKVFAVEPFYMGLAYDWLNPGEYESLFGIAPANKNLLEHPTLYGLNAPLIEDTSKQGEIIPLQKASIEEKIVDDIILVTNEEVNSKFQKIAPGAPNIMNAEKLVRWDITHELLLNRGYKVGHSSAACIGATVQKFDELKLKGATAVTIIYDDMRKYQDSITV